MARKASQLTLMSPVITSRPHAKTQVASSTFPGSFIGASQAVSTASSTAHIPHSSLRAAMPLYTPLYAFSREGAKRSYRPP